LLESIGVTDKQLLLAAVHRTAGRLTIGFESGACRESAFEIRRMRRQDDEPPAPLSDARRAVRLIPAK
jgi:hypothetical protein